MKIIISSGNDDELTEAMIVLGKGGSLMARWAMKMQGQSSHWNPKNPFQRITSDDWWNCSSAHQAIGAPEVEEKHLSSKTTARQEKPKQSQSKTVEKLCSKRELF